MLEKFHEFSPYALDKVQKETLLLEQALALTDLHYEKCAFYRNILNAMGYDKTKVKHLSDLLFIPVRLFKELTLKSIDDSQIFKTMLSSGTTTQTPSKIYCDKETALLQQKVFIRLLSDFVGKKRLPLLIIDTPSIIKDRTAFTARGAPLMSLNVLAIKMVYALNDDMSLNENILLEFLETYKGQKFLIFGFTFMLWHYFYKALQSTNKKFDMSQAYMLQSGGWKKFEQQKVSKEDFQKSFNEICGIEHFVDHYGMVEQTGCMYADCEYNHMHASIYSDVIIRNYKDFSPCKIGEEGIIQVVSSLPHSYCGHSLLTEDRGVIVGEDDCACGRKGKYIKVFGRLKSAELRGCSDVYASQF